MVDDNTRTLDDVLDGLRFAMLTTESPGGLSARPLTLMEHDGGTLRFLVALTGAARLSLDRTTIERLWNPMAKAFFDGPSDPDLAVLEVEVSTGEWWDGPSGRAGQALAMLRAVMTHDESKAGDSGTVSPGR